MNKAESFKQLQMVKWLIIQNNVLKDLKIGP